MAPNAVRGPAARAQREGAWRCPLPSPPAPVLLSLYGRGRRLSREQRWRRDLHVRAAAPGKHSPGLRDGSRRRPLAPAHRFPPGRASLRADPGRRGVVHCGAKPLVSAVPSSPRPFRAGPAARRAGNLAPVPRDLKTLPRRSEQRAGTRPVPSPPASHATAVHPKSGEAAASRLLAPRPDEPCGSRCAPSTAPRRRPSTT